ncbi:MULTISPECIES: AAA family ATPase [Gemmobacter]|jgi:adenylate kinase family enzyme|uniref:Adenylate kinase family enzyme n=1 Tax=Gemmobacter caeni TaxID=589035 RepID=A0A2T6B1C1_9RHOB|nr:MULTISPECIES: AAA family ATPase [Gemmobacter]OJY33343.1 MAG: AAA family ATPase [Rhodobacterales bacterium 65-51]PTX49879.1 adenylate kinase family enzyme [Gemmobacter caeni]TWJ01775.1 adenylate kinase family enzyme [Gemmobacter caeni]
MQRVMIVGQPGAGKSVLARQLGGLTGLPVVHIDLIHWCSGWQERTREEKTRLCQEVEAQPRWIFEGGHSATWANRLDRADTLIWIDMPLWLRLWRVLRRTLMGLGRNRPDLPEGCPERLANLPEFLGFIWRTRRSSRAAMARLVASAPAGKRVRHLQGRRAVTAFLQEVANEKGRGFPRP